MSNEEMHDLTPEVTRTILRTPAKQRHHLAIIVSEDGSVQIMARSTLPSWLRSHDLGTLAKQAEGRRVREGEILMLTMRGPRPLFGILTRESPTVMTTQPLHDGESDAVAAEIDRGIG